MKQLLILSGKGGTGKTTVASAFLELAKAGAVADCDVDAPNLHLVLKQQAPPRVQDFYGLPKAKVDQQLCTGCQACLKHCRFGAIKFQDGKIQTDPLACEGCGVCAFVCPEDAIKLVPAVAGELKLFQGTPVFSTAQLKMGSGNSGLLVTEVRQQLREAAADMLTIIDGAPGIGCPVIASVTGVDLVLIVAEPSVAGISDMERVLATVNHFGIKVAVCINKHDTNPEKTREIEAWCRRNNLPFAGNIPYDPQAVIAINNGQSLAQVDCPAGRAVKIVFSNTMKLLEQ